MNGSENDQPNPSTVTSRTTSHKPRCSRNSDNSRRDLPRARCNQAETPARNKNVGAQKCVTQRVA
jgi:hypothetical protein